VFVHRILSDIHGINRSGQNGGGAVFVESINRGLGLKPFVTGFNCTGSASLFFSLLKDATSFKARYGYQE